MYYSKAEIYTSIKNAKNPEHQMVILAQLNDCYVSDIEQIYNEYKERMNIPVSRTKTVYTDEFREKVRDCIRQGMNVKDTIRYLGLKDYNSGFSQLYYKLKKEIIKKEIKIYTEPEVLKARNSGVETKLNEPNIAKSGATFDKNDVKDIDKSFNESKSENRYKSTKSVFDLSSTNRAIKDEEVVKKHSHKPLSDADSMLRKSIEKELAMYKERLETIETMISFRESELTSLRDMESNLKGFCDTLEKLLG